MTHSISKLLSSLLAVVLLYIFPAVEVAERQDDLSRLSVYNSVVRFVDATRMKGYITPGMYEDFRRELELTDNTYEVELEHLHKKYVPDYADAANPDTFLGHYKSVFDGYYNPQLMPVLFPSNSLAKSDASRQYKMMAGDYFTVRVHNTNRTSAALYRDWLHGISEGNQSDITASYGGMVLNEDY